MSIKNWKEYINESKLPNDNNPLGFYHICNSLPPDEFTKFLDKMNISYKHDLYRNYLEVYVNNLEEASIIRKLAMSDIFIAGDINVDDIEYLDDPNDMMEIKLKI